VNPWKITYSKFIPEDENLRETICTLGNGYFGTRGAVAETAASKVHYPATYIAGAYNSLATKIAKRDIFNEDFVNCPNWLMLNYKVDDGPWFNRLKVRIISWKIELNMLRGILSRRIRWQDAKGRITLVESHRIVSMAHPHCGAMRFSIMPENYDGVITVRSGIDGSVINAGVERYKQLNSKHLEPYSHGTFDQDGIFLQMRTTQSKIQITEAVRTLVYRGHKRTKVKMQVMTHGRQKIIQEFKLRVKKGQKHYIEKLVSIYTSRDQGVADNCDMAKETVSSLKSFESLYKPHQAKWKALWKRFDVEIKGGGFMQQALRLHAFHLLQVASQYNEDIDAGMPARGLHGEAYRGHIFWDEMYVFPFYTLHAPEITRALLMYRYRRLRAAKEYAKEHNYKGAMYPWQSASKGDETTQVVHLNPLSGTWGPDFSSLQRHVSISVAYNVWTYYYTSGDRDFLNRYGAEMILEIAKFWASACTYNKKIRRYEIDQVMGPDEYHEKYPAARKGGLKNNAYTNVMATWVIEKALHILETMMEEDRHALLLKTGISEEDLAEWGNIIQKMVIVMDKKGLIHQFEGYMDLEELDWGEYNLKYDNIRRMDRILKSEGLSCDSYKVSKQADVLMLFYVLNFKELKEIFTRLGYPFSKEMMRKNFEYYFKRTSHGSTLSMVVHAYVAHLLGFKEKNEEFFMMALESDLYDTQGGTTHEGIHTGVMGSTLDLFLRMYMGMNITENKICLNPKMEEHWRSVKFSVRYQNIWYNIRVNKNKIRIMAEPVHEISFQTSTEIPIMVKNKIYKILTGKQYTFES